MPAARCRRPSTSSAVLKALGESPASRPKKRAADGVFMGERLMPVVAALDTARKARALMGQNLWLAVAYNAFAIPVALAGFVTPLIAALAMSGSSLLVTLNALRARQTRRAEG